MSCYFLVMRILSIFILLIVLESPGNTSGTLDPQCQPTRCGDNGPIIRFPFRKANSQPKNCSYSPAFDLYCDLKNQTILQLPVSVNVSLTLIDYRYQTLESYDPADNCFAGKLLHLNLSHSPFSFNDLYPKIEYFVVFNCSFAPEYGYRETCSGGKGDQLYYVEASSDIDSLISCTRIDRRSSVPATGFIQTLGDKILKEKLLQMHWQDPFCGNCESEAKFCSLNRSAIGGHRIINCIPLDPVSSKMRPVIIAGLLGSFFLVATVAGALCCYTSIKTDKKIEKFLEDYEALKPTRFLYADLRRITIGFREKLGEGSYGTVYKGNLSKEIHVAVKVLNNSKGNGEEFINEVGTIGSIYHINIVRLVGFCADGIRRALVYEYLPNYSLDKYIFQSGPRRNSLTWEKMQDIAIGIAKGIEYLHQGCNQQILHCDIKPHNILLDHNLNPKICDFGLAKFCSREQSAVSMTDARGTMGYISPEMMSRTFGRVSYKSDVYSFGMVLLEMVGGRNNIYVTRNTSKAYFPRWIYNQLSQHDHEMLVNIDDEAGEHRTARKFVIVGLWCIQWYPADRPTMKMVIQMLEGDGENLNMPPNPFPGTYSMGAAD